MTNQRSYAQSFNDLHVKGQPLVLFNIWDAGSARAVADSGAKALATGSWSVATAHGFSDGENLLLELLLGNLKRIVASVDLPVSCDIESGYGLQPEVVAQTVAQVIATGAVGVNLEDQQIGGEGLYSVEDQCKRIRAAREAAERTRVPLFINARTDIFLKRSPEDHNQEALEEALSRAEAYADAGANGFFIPGLTNAKGIEMLCNRTLLPINVMVLPTSPLPAQLANLGVARISYGPSPYRQAMETLTSAARAVLFD